MMRGYPSNEKIDVLFVTYGGGHVQAVLPVALRLNELGVRVCIFALTTAIAIVERSGLPFFTYADLPHFADPVTQRCGKRLADNFLNSNQIPENETQAYLGVNFRDLASRLGLRQATRIWKKSGRQIFDPFDTMKEVIGDLKPSLVVATNSPRSEKAAIEAATSLDVPAVTIVDIFALQEMKWLSRSSFGRHLFVLDENVRQRIISMGRSPDEVTATGNPGFDPLSSPDTIKAGLALREERGWGALGRIVVLSASTPEPGFHPFTGEPANPLLPRSVETELRNIVSADSRLELVIRRHPSEDQNISVEERISASPRTDDISTIIHAVDLVVVTCSTVGLQAYIAGVPVISVEGSVFTKDAPYGEYGMATPVPDVARLRRAISDFSSHLAPKASFVSEPVPRNATNQISSAIMEGLAKGWGGRFT